MTVKDALERLNRTHQTIKSYEHMAQMTVDLYAQFNHTSDTLTKMIEYTDRKIEEAESHYQHWHNLINEIEDDRYRDILTLRYVEGKTVEVVAEELYFSNGHVIRLTNQVIQALTHAQQGLQASVH